MSDRFTVDASAIVVMAQRYQGAGKVIEAEVLAASQRSILAVEGLAKRYVPVDTGHLRRSITSESRPVAGGVRAVAGTNVPYAEAVEKGRRAGAAMPPGDVLTGWLRRKGIDPSAEFVIRRAIGRRGIPAKPYLDRAFAELKPRIAAEFAAVPKRVLARLAAGR